MYSVLFLGFASCILSLVMTPLVRNTALRFGLIDMPDQHRKFHCAPTPRMGGVAILLAVAGAYALLLAVRFSSGAIVWEGLPLVLHLLPALALVFGIGLVDDIVSVAPWKKIVVEVAAAILAWLAGIHVICLAGHSFSGILSFVVTVLWIIACTNAINLIDGVDGLAAGVSLFAAMAMLIAASMNRNFPMALAVVAIAGALLGFLRYNFNPASIFLGDCGSLTLGFLLGCCGAVWTEKSTTLLGMTAPLLVFAVPLLDVLLAILRRFLRGQPIFSADRGHIHHKLLSRGLTPRNVVLILYGICGIGAAVSLCLTFNHEENSGFILVLVCLAIWLGLQQLGYNEFGVAGRMVLGGTFRSVLSAQLALDAFELEFRDDMSMQQCGEVLCRTCPQFGFSGIVFHVNEVKSKWGIDTGWQARIDFPGHGYINLWYEPGARGRGAAAVLFIDSVARVLNQKLNPIETIRLE